MRPFLRHGLVAGLVWCTTSAWAQDAVSYQINPQHTGATVLRDGLKLPLKRRWMRNMGGLVTYPLLGGNLVFVSVSYPQSYGSVFTALDRSTGKTVWSHPIAGTYFASLAAYDSGVVFVLNFNGVLTAFAAATGATLWQVQLPYQDEFGTPPTASGGVIYINSAGIGATVFAVRELDGSVIWSRNTNGSSFGAPTVSGHSVFVSYDCWAYELDSATGAVRWNYHDGCDGGGGTTASFYDHMLFTSNLLADNFEAGSALYPFDYQPVTANLGNMASTLSYQTGIGESYPPAFQGDLGYFVSDANGLVARAIPSLKMKWQFTGDQALSPAPIVVNGHVVIASTAGHLYVLNGSTGRLEQTLSLPTSQPLDEGGVPGGLAAGDGIIAVSYLQTLTAYAGTR